MRLAQLDRAFGYGPKGRGFESSNARTVTVLVKTRAVFSCRMKNKTSGLLVSSQTAALFEKIMGKQLIRSLTQVRYISYNKAKFKISKGMIMAKLVIDANRKLSKINKEIQDSFRSIWEDVFMNDSM